MFSLTKRKTILLFVPSENQVCVQKERFHVGRHGQMSRRVSLTYQVQDQQESQTFSGHCLAEQHSDIMAAPVHHVLAHTDYKQASQSQRRTRRKRRRKGRRRRRRRWPPSGRLRWLTLATLRLFGGRCHLKSQPQLFKTIKLMSRASTSQTHTHTLSPLSPRPPPTR